MSQGSRTPQGQQGMAAPAPPKRRSSLLVLANKEGIDIDSSLRDMELPPSLQQHFERLSNGQRKSSVSTPKGRSRVTLSQAASNAKRSKPSSIPRPGAGASGSKTKNFMGPTAASNTKAKAKQPVSVGRPKAIAKVQSGLRPSAAAGSMSAASSMDSTTWAANSMLTPAPMSQAHTMMATVSPGSTMGSRTPGSTLRSWGSQGNLASNKGPFKIPSSKDIDKINAMSEFILDVLNTLGYSTVPQRPQDLGKITTSQYYQMLIFVAQNIVGTKFFPSNPKEDPVPKILEFGSTILQYPGTISKSHLKSANAPNSWPTCLTFLFYVCCRVEAAYAPDNEVKPLFEIDNQFQQLATEHYVKLFYVHLQYKDDPEMEAALFEEEINLFRAKVSEQLMGEGNSTVEELEAMKKEKEKELAGLRAADNPIVQIQTELEMAKARIEETGEKIIRIQEKIELYKNVHSLAAQEESIKLELQGRQAEVKKLKGIVASQPINKTQAEEIMNEINEIQKQRATYKTMHINLQTDLNTQAQLLSTMDAQYRDTVARFTVVEKFNSCLLNLKLEGLAVPVNPFTPNELDQWLTSVAAIHEKTEKASQKWFKSVKKDLENISVADARAKDELENLKGLLETRKANTKAATRVQSYEEKNLEEENSRMTLQLKAMESKIASVEQELGNVKIQVKEKTVTLDQLKAKDEENLAATKEVEEEMINDREQFLNAESKVMEMLIDHTIECNKIVQEMKQDDREFKAETKALFPEYFTPGTPQYECFQAIKAKRKAEAQQQEQSTIDENQPSCSTSSMASWFNQEETFGDMSINPSTLEEPEKLISIPMEANEQIPLEAEKEKDKDEKDESPVNDISLTLNTTFSVKNLNDA